MKKNTPKSSLVLWATQLRSWPVQYLFITLLILLTIPLTLVILTIVPYAIKVINSQPALLSWTEFLGEHVTRWIRPLIQDTPLQNGIPVTLQQQWFPFILIVSAGFLALFTFLNEYYLKDLGEKLGFKLRSQIITTYLALDFKKASGLDPGFLASIVGEDIREIQNTYTRLVGGLIKESLTSVVFIAWLLILNTQLFLLLLAILIPAAIVVRITGKTLKNLSRQGLQIESELLGSTLERMRGWQTIQVHHAVPFELTKFQKINDRLYHIWRRATRARSLGTPLVEWLAIVASAFIIVAALRRISEGILNASILTSFIFTLALLSDKINRITLQLNTTRKGTEALKRILNFLENSKNELPQYAQRTAKESNFSSLEFKNIKLNIAKETAQDISLSLLPGNLLCIMGPSGSGKTTLIKTLFGLENPQSGKILIDNEEISEEFYYKNRDKICYIPQDPYIFNGTIFENVTYPTQVLATSTENLQKVTKALQCACLFLDPLQEVSGLSGGEKQRLMFARVFFHNPKLVVIDEGTSALDSENEQKVMQELLKRSSNFMTIMVAHRPAIKNYSTHLLDFTRINQ